MTCFRHRGEPLFQTHFLWQWVMDLRTRVAGSPHLQDDLRRRQEVTDRQTDRTSKIDIYRCTWSSLLTWQVRSLAASPC